ncbi:DUF1641 domain-containing protein [Effusibacillus dendaii]|uniref:DUF1641 domain-containing protein n=1 Tax=Effusibacillus dendaii TaxID=2743772 RepID=A0A7I8D7M4_9BACL|nr:DUF1641 domain-containing protein [Effusibacillus dendaii]BCJ86163.1 hypothetical protein skT53_11480 [Effusibacillus dendaii]
MARAITHIEKQLPNPEQEQVQAIGQILEAVAESRDTLLMTLDILKELHASGVLNILQGILKNRQQIGAIAFTQLNQPGIHHGLKNLIGLAQFLGKLDPAQLQTMLNGVARGLEQSGTHAAETKPIGLWNMGKMLRDPDVNASINMMLQFLRGMGEGINGNRSSVH